MKRVVNSESLHLYRDILRASKYFTWRQTTGELWSDILKKNARKEFEEARHERDPIIVARLLFTGRECLNKSMEKFDSAQRAMKDHFDKTRND